jgi:TolA-binding protein
MEQEVIAALSYRIKQLESQYGKLHGDIDTLRKKIEILSITNKAVFNELDKLSEQLHAIKKGE